VKLRNQDGGQQQGGRETRKRRGVSGYLQEWAGWRGGGGEEGSKSLPPVPALQGEDLWAFWDQVLIEWNTGGGAEKSQSQVKELVRRGIPNHLRGIAWQVLSGARKSELGREQYPQYLETTSACEKAIHRDIARTYPEHQFFAERGGVGQEALFNVMKAYSVHDREVGYCQGSAFIVGLLLMQMPEEEAFTVLVRIMQEYRMREMFKPSMAELGLCMYQLDTLIQEHIPDLYVHFQSQAIHTNLYASSWFLTLFSTALPLPLACRVMDCFLSEGIEVIFRLSLTLLLLGKPDLLIRDIEGVTKYFREEMPAQFEADPDHVFAMAFGLSINQKKIKKMEKEYKTMKSKENEDEVEIRRLRGEARLLRQRMDALEVECGSLADSLLQGQVTKAENEEGRLVAEEQLQVVLRREEAAREQLAEADTQMKAEKSRAAALEALLEEERASHQATREASTTSGGGGGGVETTVVEDEGLGGEEEGSENSKAELKTLRSLFEQAKLDNSHLRGKMAELRGMWRQQGREDEGKVGASGGRGPVKLLSSLLEGGKGEAGLAAKLKEVETDAEVRELRLRVREVESQLEVAQAQAGRQDQAVSRLRDLLDQEGSRGREERLKLKERERRVQELEGRLKDDQLMGRIREAEHSQQVASLQQRIAELEVERTEAAARGELRGCLEEDRVAALQAQVAALTRDATLGLGEESD